MDKMNHLERLGRAVADAPDQASDPDALKRVRTRFLAADVKQRARSKRVAWAFVFAAACAVAIVFDVGTRRPDVSFFVGTPSAPGVVGNWISAGESSTALHFSEGTELELAPGARVRVTETNARGAAVLIESGHLHAKVTHQSSDTRWAFRAGPFDVRVTGTEFDASWNPIEETFELAMTNGSVFTTGPLLRDGRSLLAGERLRVSIRENKLEIRATGHVEKASVETNPSPALTITPVPPSSEHSGSTNDASETNVPRTSPRASARIEAQVPNTAPSEADWKALAASGKHKDALAAAERAGFSQEVARASAAELFTLADAARLGGSPARAREALFAARTRFGVRGRTAFLIGKIAADQQRSPGEAATWFETYLREEPGGQLEEQALGRLIEIRRRGDGAAARSLAERYLARYPRGGYAALARSVLEP